MAKKPEPRNVEAQPTIRLILRHPGDSISRDYGIAASLSNKLADAFLVIEKLIDEHTHKWVCDRTLPQEFGAWASLGGAPFEVW